MVTPIAFVATAILAGFGVLPWIVPIAIAVLNIVLTQVLAAEARSRIGLVAEQFPSISQYAELLAQVERMPGESAAVRALRDRVKMEGRTASDLLGDLGRRAAYAVPPGTLLYLPLQAIFAWDINVLARLESWQATAGSHVRDWLATIGDAEALAALATLAYDEPTWTMPAVDGELDSVRVAGLGHPLLQDDARVVNDIEIGPPGTFLLVTGSNMSGKSTLLRAIGVNLVLAGAGGPVCASAFSAPPVRLWTSVRVEDSLERGVSFFMAELQRLKQVVDAATGGDPAEGRLLYLLDEILQGTNTSERQIAARRVIRHLVDEGAIGAVSTHDLTLAEGPELDAVAQAVHLRDTVTATGMSFDYKLRPGVATSTNALRLMDIVFGETRAAR
jgi:DNA mismatch repair ATPase MutS